MSGVFDVLNVRVSIAGRMRILGVLMIVPVAITGFLLYKTHKANIDFARSELAGAQYLGSLWPDMMAGASGEDARVSESLTQQARSNAGMVDPAKVEALSDASGPQLLAATNALIAEITDKSKLILDPDLDSYYMMDAVTTKLPAVVMAAAAVHDNPSSEINTVTFDNAVAALHDSFEKSGQYGKTGRLKDDTEAALAAVMEAAKAFRADPSAYDAFLKACDNVFAPGDRDLVAMQKLRADRETARMIGELSLAFAILAVALAVAASIAMGLSGRLARLSALMQGLAEGRDIGEVPFQSDGHETGVIARTLSGFRRALGEAEAARASQARLEADSQVAQKETMRAMADRFESTLLGIVDKLNGSTEGLGQTASRLTRQAEQTRQRSQSAAHAVGQASGNVQSVAGATEEMAASARSIAEQAERAAEAAGDAAARAREANGKVAAMNEAASRIGSSIDMITRITTQTNLLALNATIEAARAGEAGKGFTVVATEVKALAQQTARATEEISQQVRGVQTATAEAAEAMTAIAAMVTGLRDISNAISDSVAQQTSAVGEISRSTAEVAGSTADITGAVEEVNATAGETGDAALEAQSAVQDLAGQTRVLKQTAVDFLASVRAA